MPSWRTVACYQAESITWSILGDKTVVRSSYLHKWISYIGKMSSLYWIRPRASTAMSLAQLTRNIPGSDPEALIDCNRIGNSKSKLKMDTYWLLPSYEGIETVLFVKKILLHFIAARYWRTFATQRTAVRSIINKCCGVSSHELSTKVTR